jgi:hypothetical protein
MVRSEQRVHSCCLSDQLLTFIEFLPGFITKCNCKQCFLPCVLLSHPSTPIMLDSAHILSDPMTELLKIESNEHTVCYVVCLKHHTYNW